MAERGGPLSCPSAQPDMEDARIFGIVAGTAEAPRVAYLKAEAIVSEETIEALGEIKPTRLFRYAARCEESRCAQYDKGCCSLGKRIAEMLPEVTDALPSCQIRPTCRWYAEVGRPACLRCPQVMTLVPSDGSNLARVSIPPTIGDWPESPAAG